MELSENVLKLKPSATAKVNMMQQDMARQGIDVVNFSVGEPDFDTPEFVKQAAIKAMEQGFTKYTANTGVPELREAIADKLKRDNDLDYKPSQIVVTNGARQAIANAIAVVTNPGDEVMIITPAWVSYQQLILLFGCVPVAVPTTRENNYMPTREALESKVTDKTKLLILTSPSNPTGRVFDEETLKMVADFALAHDLFVISDEVYEKLIFDDDVEHISIASLSPEMYEHTIVVNGLSKSHAMTGWRMGYSASTEELARLMGNVLNHYTTAISSITQAASIAALRGDENCIDEMNDEYRKRRDYIYERICGIDGLKAVKPQGAFYLFIDISDIIGKEYHGKRMESAADFAEALLRDKAVALVSSEDFGIDNHVRISFATSMENLKKGADRIEEFVNELS